MSRTHPCECVCMHMYACTLYMEHAGLVLELLGKQAKRVRVSCPGFHPAANPLSVQNSWLSAHLLLDNEKAPIASGSEKGAPG